MDKKLTIQIVGWNSAAVLPAAIAALRQVPEELVEIRYIDNASTDDSVRIIKEGLPQTDVICLPKNMGFAWAHNAGLVKCGTPYVLTHDPDVAIEWAGIERLLDLMEEQPKWGAVQGLLHRAGRSHREAASSGRGDLIRQDCFGPEGPPAAANPPSPKATEGRGAMAGRHNNDFIIDSAGIVKTLALNGRERGAGEIDKGQFSKRARLWSVTGACGLWRMGALREVAYSKEEFFDNAFFAYKEDVDLGWRLNKAGWEIWFEPARAGTHRRTMGRGGAMGWGLSPQRIFTRLKSPRTRLSLRNWAWMVRKNMTAGDFWRHELFVELRLLVFLKLTLIYPPLFSVWREIAQGMPGVEKKRDLQSRKKEPRVMVN